MPWYHCHHNVLVSKIKGDQTIVFHSYGLIFKDWGSPYRTIPAIIHAAYRYSSRKMVQHPISNDQQLLQYIYNVTSRDRYDPRLIKNFKVVDHVFDLHIRTIPSCLKRGSCSSHTCDSTTLFTSSTVWSRIDPVAALDKHVYKLERLRKDKSVCF